MSAPKLMTHADAREDAMRDTDNVIDRRDTQATLRKSMTLWVPMTLVGPKTTWSR